MRDRAGGYGRTGIFELVSNLVSEAITSRTSTDVNEKKTFLWRLCVGSVLLFFVQAGKKAKALERAVLENQSATTDEAIITRMSTIVRIRDRSMIAGTLIYGPFFSQFPSNL